MGICPAKISQNKIDTPNPSSYTSGMPENTSRKDQDRRTVIFIIPPSESRVLKFVTYQQPINLAYLAAAVIRAGFSAEIQDYGIGKFSERDFIEHIRKTNPLAVGIHCKTFNITSGNDLAGVVKKHFPGLLIIVGGPHSSALPAETLDEFPNFDAVVIGEGELTIAALCRQISAGEDLKEVRGLALREGNQVMLTGQRELISNLDDIDYPARHLLMPKVYDRYHSTRGISPLNYRSTEIFTSRGCPGKCIFCAANLSYGNCVRFRTADNVLGEVEACVERYQYNHIIVQDDTFTLNKNRVNKILSGFRQLGLKSWSCDSRVDTVDKEMLDDMAAAGCKKISFGVESGSERVLKLIKKNVTVEQIVRAVEQAKASGIDIVECTFMIGSHPDETYDDVQASWRLIKKLSPDIIAVSVIVPYPGTEVYKLMDERGYVGAGKWDEFQIIGAQPAWRTANFSPAEMMKLQRKLLNRYYFNPAYLMKRLSKFENLNEMQYFFKTGWEYARFVMKNKIRD